MATVKDLSGNNPGTIDTSVGAPQGQIIYLTDGVTAPAASAGVAKIFIDAADGDLKIRFADGTLKVISADT